MKMKVKHNQHVSQPLLYQLSNTSTLVKSTVECKCQLGTAIVFHFPMERFFTRRAGPPVTAWQERHSEEDFHALVRHNAATKLEIEQRPPAAKKRRVGKPISDEQYTRALCDWVVTLVEHPETLPQAKRPGWWRHGVSLFGGRSAPTGGAEAVAGLEPSKSNRAYHQPSRDLRLWVVDYALLRHLQGWDNRMIADHLAAWLPDVFRLWLSTRTLRRWLDENEKEGREPRDACAAIIPILREKCARVGEAGVPISASVTRRFSIKWIRHVLPCARDPGIASRQAGSRKRRTPSRWTRTWNKLRLRLMYFVIEYNVHPSCIMNLDETAAKLLGLGQRGWARPKQVGRVALHWRR